MAAFGPDVVPASGRGGDPGWLEGIYRGGLGIDGSAYIWLERVALVLYAAVMLCAGAIPRRLVWWGTGFAVGAFVLSPPLLSLDVFSYVSYARLDADGLNPYLHAPADAPGDPALDFIGDWRDSVSVYGPLFTIATAPLGNLSVGAAVWLLKVSAGLSVGIIGWTVARLAALRGVDPRFAVAFVCLNPLVLVHVVGGAHNDALMAALMMLSVAGVVMGVRLLGGIGLVAAAAVKASALLVAPFALIGAGHGRWRLLAGIAIGAVALLGVGLAAFGTSIDEAAKVVGQNQGLTSRASVPGTISREMGWSIDFVRPASLALFAIALCGLLAWTARGADWVRATGWGTLGLLVATSYLTPWYTIWALPHAAVARDRVLAVATVALSAFLLRYQVPGLGG